MPYTNTTDKPVTLTLAVQKVTGNNGSAVASPIARLGARTLTVPAGGTAEVPLKLDPAAEKIVSDDDAQKLIRRTYREGHWAVPKGV